MTRQNTIIATLTVTIVMVFGLLIYMQVSAIREIMTVRTRQFDQTVNYALGDMVKRVAEQEIGETAASDNFGRRDVEQKFGLRERGRRNSPAIGLKIEETAPAVERIDWAMGNALHAQGIDLEYHWEFVNERGERTWKCEDFDAGGTEGYEMKNYTSSGEKEWGVRVFFPGKERYIYGMLKPTIRLMGCLSAMFAAVFCAVMVIVFRQKRLSQMKNDFVSNITHELKTPISTISLATQMIGETAGSGNPEGLKHLAGMAESEAQRLNFLIEKILQMSAFDHEKSIFQFKAVGVNEMVEKAAATMDMKIAAVGGELDIRCEAVNDKVVGDETHLMAVVYNLLDNALKYSGDKPVRIGVRTYEADGRVWMEVRDHGIGMSRSVQRKIFKRFYRAHTGNHHDIKGTGLGLAYVKKVVSEHGGRITVASEVGEGTTFGIGLQPYKTSEA